MGLFSLIRSKTEKRQSKAPKSSVIVPLYIYPATSATWAPLHEAIDVNPNLNFLVIINPNSGPGDAPWWPNVDYLREVPKLNAKPNVRTLGYVRVDYCNRDVQEAIDDVRKYAKWPHDTAVKYLHVEGIFFDETPCQHSSFKGTYLEKITEVVKASEGILGDKLVVHNPGIMTDQELTKQRPDVTVVFEEAHSTLANFSDEERCVLDNFDRSAACVMVHSTPYADIKDAVRDAQFRAEYVFVTDNCEGYYEKFGHGWQDFVAFMAAN